MTKRVDERIDEGVLLWFGHVKRMENDKIAKRVYVGVCAGSHLVNRPRKRWINTVKDHLRKRNLDVRQARRMAGFVKGNAWCNPWDEPVSFTRCHSYMKPLKGGSLSAA